MPTTWRPITPADAPALTTLLNTVAEADGTGETTTEDLVAEVFQMPRFDADLDTFSAWSGDEAVGVGYVLVRETPVEGRAMVAPIGAIHPDRRGEGLGAELLSRLERRGIDLAHERLPTTPVRLRASGGLQDSSAQRLLEQAGYVPDNYFQTMEVDLASWQDPGTDVTSVAPDPALSEATREAHNDAFRDHRNFSPIPQDSWEHWRDSTAYRPTLSRVVVVDGRVLAYALASEYVPGTVHMDLIGTRREARGRGLAKDVLIAGLRASRAAGKSTNELEVDSTSPTGADRLYTSVGYRTVRVISRYIRDVAEE